MRKMQRPSSANKNQTPLFMMHSSDCGGARAFDPTLSPSLLDRFICPINVQSKMINNLVLRAFLEKDPELLFIAYQQANSHQRLRLSYPDCFPTPPIYPARSSLVLGPIPWEGLECLCSLFDQGHFKRDQLDSFASNLTHLTFLLTIGKDKDTDGDDAAEKQCSCTKQLDSNGLELFAGLCFLQQLTLSASNVQVFTFHSDLPWTVTRSHSVPVSQILLEPMDIPDPDPVPEQQKSPVRPLRLIDLANITIDIDDFVARIGRYRETLRSIRLLHVYIDGNPAHFLNLMREASLDLEDFSLFGVSAPGMDRLSWYTNPDSIAVASIEDFVLKRSNWNPFCRKSRPRTDPIDVIRPANNVSLETN